jgi:hypothetical protein
MKSPVAPASTVVLLGAFSKAVTPPTCARGGALADRVVVAGGGGGGGYYGGGGGEGSGSSRGGAGGGGGSSFTVAGATNVTHQQGVRAGDGQVAITFTVPIPTLSEWAQLAMLAVLLGRGLLALRRRARPA